MLAALATPCIWFLGLLFVAGILYWLTQPDNDRNDYAMIGLIVAALFLCITVKNANF